MEQLIVEIVKHLYSADRQYFRMQNYEIKLTLLYICHYK